MDKVGYFLVLLYAFSAHISPAAASVAIYGSLPVLIYQYFKKKEKLSYLNEVNLAIGAFFLVFSFTCLFSYDPWLSFEKVIGHAMRFVPFFMAIFFIKDKKQLWTVAGLLGLSILFADGISFVQYYQGKMATGFDHNHIYFANELLPMIVLSLVMIFSEQCSGQWKCFYGFMGIISFIVLLFSQARGVWLALAGVIVVYALLLIKKRPRLVIYLLIFLIVFSLCLWFVPVLHQRLLTITDTNFQANTERVLMLQGAWAIFLDHPIVGIGVSEFRIIYNTEYISSLAKEVGNAHPHNNFMTYLAETGIVGFAVFCCLFYTVLYRLYKDYCCRKINKEWAVIGFLATIGFLLGGLTDHTFGMMNVLRLVWFMIGMGLVRVSNSEVI